MTRHTTVRKGSFRCNCLAAMISSSAMFGLFLTFHAAPTGAGHDVRYTLAQISAPNLQLAVVSPSPEISTMKGVAIDPAQVQQQVQAAVHSSRVALELYVALLELGISRLERTSDYTASFFKQERREGNEEELSEMQVMDVKVRHAPFSVFMNWTEGEKEGQEVLYVDGQESNRMVVKLGGFKGRLAPALKLDPSGDLAMKEARHPITDMGLLNLTRKIITYRKRDLVHGKGVQWKLIPDQKCFDRDCVCLLIQYESKEYDKLYRKTLTYIDKELSLPICIKNFTWPSEEMKLEGEKLDEATCIEYYGYKDVKLNAGLKEVDFDQANEDYHFVRR